MQSHRCKFCLLLWALALPLFAGPGTAFPQHFDLNFELTRQGLTIAQVRWKLEALPGRVYRYTSNSQTIGIAKLFRDEHINEISDWRFSGNAVQSLHYQYSRSGGKRRRQSEASFDWANGKLHNHLNGKHWTAPLPVQTYDKLNYLLALMHDLGRGLRPAHYQVADGSKLKVYDLQYLQEERIETVLGSLQTLVFDRTVKGDKKITRVWAAKSLSYLPVKIEHREDGEIVGLRLSRLSGFDGYIPATRQ